jgi:2-keto-4-pentenoate hydratase/2-oxohepta-3-ene-1,7-dioic acid hydratase in catechol pathway
MRLISYRSAAGDAAVGILTDDGVQPLTTRADVGVSAMRRLLTEWNGLPDHLGRLRADVAPIPLDEIELLPIVPDPGKVVAAPVNYLDHKAEMSETSQIDGLGVFLKAPTSVLADGGVVRLPYTDRRFDQEGELAVVIGATASHVRAEDALGHIAGYTMLLDMTMRGGEDRSTRKSFDTFTPIGPWLVTPDEAGAPEDMRLRTWVNGDLRQDAKIEDLIWGVPALIAYASSVMVLRPGDILTTGTPAGIGAVHDTDVIRLEITGLGALGVAVSAAGAVLCPTKGTGLGPKPPATVTPIRSRVD